MKRNVLLIEFNTWHGECLSPQLQYLKAGANNITLLCPKKSLTALDNEALKDIEYVECREKKGIINILKVWCFIIKKRPDVVVFNTAQGSEVMKLMLMPFPSHIKFVGTIHNLSKLKKSTGQKIIDRKLSGYYVAAKYLLGKLNAISNKPAQFYLPINKTISKENTDYSLIVIPGTIEFKRRNYDKLLEMAKSSLLADVTFVLLCNHNKGNGPEFLKKVLSLGLEKRFVTFSEFVPSDEYDHWMTKCSYILPLIDGEMKNGQDYLDYKMSGTFSLSAVYGKTMLCDSFLSAIEDFDYPHIFYSTIEEMASLIKSHAKPDNYPSYSFNNEAERYNSLINIALH